MTKGKVLDNVVEHEGFPETEQPAEDDLVQGVVTVVQS